MIFRNNSIVHFQPFKKAIRSFRKLNCQSLGREIRESAYRRSLHRKGHWTLLCCFYSYRIYRKISVPLCIRTFIIHEANLCKIIFLLALIFVVHVGEKNILMLSYCHKMKGAMQQFGTPTKRNTSQWPHLGHFKTLKSEIEFRKTLHSLHFLI